MRYELTRASAAPSITERYYAALEQCYTRFKAGAAAQGRAHSDSLEDLWLVVVHAHGQLLGGVGIHRRVPSKPLPIERALPYCDPLRAKLDAGGPVAELSGLWVDPSLRGTGLSADLMEAGISAVTPTTGAERLVALGHQRLLGYYATFGLVADRELPSYAYPTPAYVSSVLWCDPQRLSTVEDALTAQRMMELRARFEQGRTRWAAAPVAQLSSAARDWASPSRIRESLR